MDCWVDFLGPCTQVHGQGFPPPSGRGRGGGDAGSLLPGVLPPELGACIVGAYGETHTSYLIIRTTTTTTRSHFGSSRDRLPGFRLGSFTSVGSSGATMFPSACAQVLVVMCYSMLMNRGSSLALFFVLLGSAPSQVRAAGIGQGENNPVNEFDTGNRLVSDSFVPVTFGSVPCVSCSSPGVRKPRWGKGGLVRVFATSLLSCGAAPSLHSCRHTVDLVAIVKFDQKVS